MQEFARNGTPAPVPIPGTGSRRRRFLGHRLFSGRRRGGYPRASGASPLPRFSRQKRCKNAKKSPTAVLSTLLGR